VIRAGAPADLAFDEGAAPRLIASASTALARRGSERRCRSAPTTRPAWSTSTGTGCGYAAGREVYVDVEKPEALAFTSVLADENGCIRIAINTDGPGMYHISARRLANKHWVVLATYDLPVV
jgi:hypothetical protein